MSSISMERVIDALFARDNAVKNSGQPVDNSEFMKSLCEIYGLKHSAYITVDKRSFVSRKPKFLVTYPVEWQAEYRKTFAEQKDPVMQAGMSEILPLEACVEGAAGVDNAFYCGFRAVGSGGQ